jgi:peptidoglycan/xylan/chitin deacetylase (PgdA/CDA1 family)
VNKRALLFLLLASASSAWNVPAARAAAASTVVSLTFDDGSADQALAGRMLGERGLKGTFYINSAQLGSSSWYMTRAQVDALRAAGHEIGGHTLSHPALDTIASTEAVRQICDDRANLVAWGYDPVSFAYPFGSYNAAIQSMVRACGYSSARTVGLGYCPTCVNAESVPPPDRFAIRAPASIVSSQNLADLETLVTAAENAGGGWVPLVFHHICDGCPGYSVSSATLGSFLDWLNARAARGTAVMTVAQVMSAPPPPPVPAPVPVPAPAPAPVPAPVLTALSPSEAPVGGPGFVMTALGFGFVRSTTLRWNGSDRATTVVSGTTLRAIILPSDLLSPTTAFVTVFTPGPGGGSASPLSLVVASSTGAPAAALLDGARVFPNPWRADRHGGLPLTIDGLPARSAVSLFTVSGRRVRTLDVQGGAARWDLADDSGERVASGLYLYLISDGEGRRRRGVVGVIR